jgi:hypothetical protein
MGDPMSSPTEARMLQIFTRPLPALGVGGVLAPEEWSTFLDAVSAELAGSPVVVDVALRGTPRTVVVRGVLHALVYDPRGDVLEVAVQTPTPNRISVLRHLISHPTGVATDCAKGLLPSLVVVEDANGDVTRVRLLPSPAFSG